MATSFLSKIVKGTLDLPPRIVLIGQIKIGKSTYASKAPDPLFIAAEDGLTGLEETPRLQPHTYQEVKDILDEIEGAASLTFKTLVIDTLDWLERMVHEFICKRDKQPTNIDEYLGGFGKGDKAAATEAVSMCAQLDRIRHKHKVGIIILSHAQIKAITLPGSDPFDRYMMKGGKQWTGVFGEWPDAVLFAMFELFTTGKKREEKVIQGDRVIRTSPMTGWDAGNRYSLPDPLPLDHERGYMALLDSIEANKPKPAQKMTVAFLCERIRTLAPLVNLPEERKAKFDVLMETLDEQPLETLKAMLVALEEVTQ